MPTTTPIPAPSRSMSLGRDMNVKASIPIFRELLSPSGSEPSDVRGMAAFFAGMQRQRAAQGWSGIPPLCGHPQTDTFTSATA